MDAITHNLEIWLCTSWSTKVQIPYTIFTKSFTYIFWGEAIKIQCLLQPFLLVMESNHMCLLLTVITNRLNGWNVVSVDKKSTFHFQLSLYMQQCGTYNMFGIFRIVPSIIHAMPKGFMLIILVTACSTFVMKVLMTFRNYSMIMMCGLILKDK